MSSTTTMTPDELADRRALLSAEINGQAMSRESLGNRYGIVWDTTELRRNFTVVGFQAPVVLVKRKRDNAVGTVLFQHAPRLYFGFEAAASSAAKLLDAV